MERKFIQIAPNLIGVSNTAEAAIEAFKHAAKQARTFAPMIHTDRGAAYTSKDFNNYLTSNNSKHSLSAPGTPADNAVIEHYWGDFKYIWMAHHSHPQTLTELKDLVRQGVEYFNKVEISSKRNNLIAEDLAIIPLRVTLEIIKVSFLRGFSYAQLFDNGQAQAAQRLSGF